jgi:hypothetical protein
MAVARPMSSAMRLGWVGSRCATTTKAIPVSAGIAPKNLLRASRPPADEPSPTMMGTASGTSGGVARASRVVGPACVVREPVPTARFLVTFRRLMTAIPAPIPCNLETSRIRLPTMGVPE